MQSNPLGPAWLNIVAFTKKSIKDILQDHYAKYGRNFFSRYDYEEISGDGPDKFVKNLDSLLADKSFIGTKFPSSTGDFEIASTSNFSYTDPIDGSVSKNQGHIFTFTDGSRVIFRLSGTGSQGATVRVYIERYTQDSSQYTKPTAEGLKGLIEVALKFSKLTELLEREKPTVITVSTLWYTVIGGWLTDHTILYSNWHLSITCIEMSIILRRRRCKWKLCIPTPVSLHRALPRPFLQATDASRCLVLQIIMKWPLRECAK